MEQIESGRSKPVMHAPGSGMWHRPATGKYIRIRDMTDSHLTNTILQVARRAKKGYVYGTDTDKMQRKWSVLMAEAIARSLTLPYRSLLLTRFEERDCETQPDDWEGPFWDVD